jgi:hypothetical protein
LLPLLQEVQWIGLVPDGASADEALVTTQHVTFYVEAGDDTLTSERP